MALIKIYSLPKNKPALINQIAKDIKRIAARALNTLEIPTNENSIETVFCEGIDLIGIDYILEIIAIERPNLQTIASTIITELNHIHPKTKFSIYFNLISENGMANTPRGRI